MARTKYGAYVSENLLATTWGEHIFSCEDDTQDVENGWVGFVGDLVNGKEIREFIQPTAATISTEELVVVMQPPEVKEGYSYADFRDEYFINDMGVPFRCYKVKAGDSFAITDYTIDAIDPTNGVQVGNFVVAQDGSNRLKEITTPAGTEVFVGKIQDFKATGYTVYGSITTSGETSNLRYASIYTIKNTKA